MSRKILDMSNDKLEELFSKTNDNFEEVYQKNADQDLDLDTKAKQSDLSVLKSRVDSLVANPGESTEGNAELIDIRVGADGKTYSNAGEAVRGQSSRLNTIINGSLLTELAFENGTIRGDGVLLDSDTRIRNTEFIRNPLFLVTSFDKTFQVYILFYDSNKNIIKNPALNLATNSLLELCYCKRCR